MGRRLAPHLRLLAGMLLGLVTVLGCTRPIDRPLEGARSSVSGDAARGTGVPPTLAPPVSTPTVPPPSPVVRPVPSASPSLTGRNPILSGLLPPPSAVIPPGSVNIGARISASSDLTTVSLNVNGAAVQPQVTTQDPRVWLVAYTGQLGEGRHEVRLNARDQDGRAGGYTWQFEVRPRAQLSPVPRAQPTLRP